MGILVNKEQKGSSAYVEKEKKVQLLRILIGVIFIAIFFYLGGFFPAYYYYFILAAVLTALPTAQVATRYISFSQYKPLADTSYIEKLYKHDAMEVLLHLPLVESTKVYFYLSVVITPIEVVIYHNDKGFLREKHTKADHKKLTHHIEKILQHNGMNLKVTRFDEESKFIAYVNNELRSKLQGNYQKEMKDKIKTALCDACH